MRADLFLPSNRPALSLETICSGSLPLRTHLHARSLSPPPRGSAAGLNVPVVTHAAVASASAAAAAAAATQLEKPTSTGAFGRAAQLLEHTAKHDQATEEDLLCRRRRSSSSGFMSTESEGTTKSPSPPPPPPLPLMPSLLSPLRKNKNKDLGWEVTGADKLGCPTSPSKRAATGSPPPAPDRPCAVPLPHVQLAPQPVLPPQQVLHGSPPKSAADAAARAQQLQRRQSPPTVAPSAARRWLSGRLGQQQRPAGRPTGGLFARYNGQPAPPVGSQSQAAAAAQRRLPAPAPASTAAAEMLDRTARRRGQSLPATAALRQRSSSGGGSGSGGGTVPPQPPSTLRVRWGGDSDTSRPLAMVQEVCELEAELEERRQLQRAIVRNRDHCLAQLRAEENAAAVAANHSPAAPACSAVGQCSPSRASIAI